MVGVFALLLTGVGPNLPSHPLVIFALAGCGLFLNFAVLPVVTTFLNVAYCHELDAVFRGRRPRPGSGLVAATHRLPEIALGALAVSGAFFAGYYSDTESLRTGSGLLGVFLAPAIATEDGGVRDLASRIESVVTGRWGSGLVVVYSAKTLSHALGVLGIGSAVGLVVAHVLGALPFDPAFEFLPVGSGLPQVLVLAVAVFLGGLFASSFLTALVAGPVSTALYHDATGDCRLESVALDVEDLVTIDRT